MQMQLYSEWTYNWAFFQHSSEMVGKDWKGEKSDWMEIEK